MDIQNSKYYGIYFLKNKKVLSTKNLTPGKSFFKERLFKVNDSEFREFNPRRSKLGAAVIKKISIMPLNEGNKVLYLGASHGYTPSFVSDIVGDKGVVFCVDFAPRVVRDLIFICEERKNMSPILASANKPETYEKRITNVDVIYQDIAQKNQVEILFKNLRFLKERGYVILTVKSRSIDVTKQPSKIFREVEEKLKQKLRIIDQKELDPFEKDHALFI